MKQYRMLLHDSEKNETQTISIFLDPRKAYIESILYNLSDLEDMIIEDSYPNQIKNILHFYFSQDFKIHELKDSLENFSISRLIELQEILYKFQIHRGYYCVSLIV
jgi:hypothetical protein